MCQRAKLQSNWKVHNGADSELMRAVETVRPEVFVGVREVGCTGCEVRVECGRLVAGQRVPDLEIQVVRARQRVLDIGFQAGLHAAIKRAPDGEEHLIHADIGIDARECARGAGCASGDSET